MRKIRKDLGEFETKKGYVKKAEDHNKATTFFCLPRGGGVLYPLDACACCSGHQMTRKQAIKRALASVEEERKRLKAELKEC